MKICHSEAFLMNSNPIKHIKTFLICILFFSFVQSQGLKPGLLGFETGQNIAGYDVEFGEGGINLREMCKKERMENWGELGTYWATLGLAGLARLAKLKGMWGGGKAGQETFVDQMTSEEAARYGRYWSQELEGLTRQRLQVSPGTKSIKDVKLSSETGEPYMRETIYDEFGRLKGVNDYTTHGNNPLVHTVPHYHTINSINWKQGIQHGPATPGLHPDTP